MNELANGNCFSVAAKIVGGFTWALGDLDATKGVEVLEEYGAEDPKLVHGTVTRANDGREHEHAWVEAGDLVFDFSNGLDVVLSASAYHDLGKIKNTKAYTKEEARDALLTIGHFGPWH